MSNKNISYLNRNFDDYRASLIEYVKTYYPQIANDFNDASIGSWLIDLVASIGDNLSFYIDKAYSETNIDTAKNLESIFNLAHNYGYKIPGPKGSVAEVEFSCVVPCYTSGSTINPSMLGMPDPSYIPVIKKGTKLSSRNQIFEVMEDIDFSKRTNKYGTFNLDIIPNYNSASDTKPVGYKLIKSKEIVVAGESKIYKQVIQANDIKPFMEFTIPDANVMNVESIIFKVGTDYQYDPTMAEFMINKEHYIRRPEGKEEVELYRFFEVNSLADQYIWGEEIKGVDDNEPSVSYEYSYYDNISMTEVPSMSVCKGKWNPISQKFITEFTEKGYLKVIFGSGEQIGQDVYDDVSDIGKYQMTKMIRNNFLGKLPREGWTMYILYRANGGASSNVAAGTITNINYYNVSFPNAIYGSYNCEILANVKDSITVTNPLPSVSGKDMPTGDEIKAMIKYNSASQERCVTVKDYENRIAMLPPQFGCPFKVSVTEENNKIMIYLLGLDNKGKLTNAFPELMLYNIIDYLSMYRSINDYIEIKPGEVINLSFETDVFIDKNYNENDVFLSIFNTIKKYMDINKHRLGEDIFVGDIEKEISNIDGVLNLIDLRVYNLFGNTYSGSKITQKIIEDDSSEGRNRIDLDSEQYILNSNNDSMFEIKNPEKDIIVRMIPR